MKGIEGTSPALLAVAAAMDARVASAGPRPSTLVLDVGAGEVRAEVDGDWLLLEAALPASGPAGGARSFLLESARLAGLAKLGLRAGGWRPSVLAELPANGDDDLEALLRATRSGFRQALGLAGAVDAESAAGAALGPVDFQDLCSAAGWAVEARGRRAPVVPLDSGGDPCRAELEDLGPAGVRVSATVARAEAPAPESREALGVLLLVLNGHSRLVRGGAVEDPGGEVTAFLEARLPAPPSAALLGHALSALSVACRLGAAEARAVLDAQIARRYLEVRGWSSASDPGR